MSDEPRVVGPGFHDKVYEVVKTVPAGRVATYGDVATVLGSPRVARHVGWALAAIVDQLEVPWHRIINAKGTISARGDVVRATLQRDRLEAEGVEFDAHDRVDLARFRHVFSPDEVPES
ncbi:MAG: methylated-DNA--[protein]-cysteine S-methyltransferase [Myxococcota bacterium]